MTEPEKKPPQRTKEESMQEAETRGLAEQCLYKNIRAVTAWELLLLCQESTHKFANVSQEEINQIVRDDMEKLKRGGN